MSEIKYRNNSVELTPLALYKYRSFDKRASKMISENHTPQHCTTIYSLL